jgi:hypothetical protein
MLNEDLLRAHIADFWGFGHASAPFWFIGMEQGGGATPEELARRLSAWDARGRCQWDDLREYCGSIGEPRWFRRPTPPIQPTWKHLIRIALGARGQSTDTESVRRYQLTELGCRGSESALLELFPLPAPSTQVWPYAQWSALPELASRDQYRAFVGQRREVGLRRLIETHRPKLVVFYGLEYRDRWSRIAAADFSPTGLSQTSEATFDSGDGHRTVVFVVPHPASYGVTSALFAAIGARAHDLLRQGRVG